MLNDTDNVAVSLLGSVKVTTTELAGDRQRLRRRASRQNVVCRCHSTRYVSYHRETNNVVAAVSNGEGHCAFADSTLDQ